MAKKPHSIFLITELEKFLKRTCKGLFDINNLEIISSGNVFTIGPCNGIATMFSGKEYVIPLFIKPETDDKKIIYYLGLTLQFPVEGRRAEPSLVSIRFFTGARSEDISMIFRAEFQKDSKEEHSQPHWHFHFVEEKKQPAHNFEEFDLKAAEAFQAHTRYSEINGIHFCMSWNTKGHSLDLTDNVLHWIKETIFYVHAQLGYVHKRHSMVS